MLSGAFTLDKPTELAGMARDGSLMQSRPGIMYIAVGIVLTADSSVIVWHPRQSIIGVSILLLFGKKDAFYISSVVVESRSCGQRSSFLHSYRVFDSKEETEMFKQNQNRKKMYLRGFPMIYG